MLEGGMNTSIESTGTSLPLTLIAVNRSNQHINHPSVLLCPESRLSLNRVA